MGGQRSDPGPLAPGPACWPAGASPLAAGVPPAAHGRPWQTPQIGHVSADPEPCDTRQKPLLPENKDRKSFHIVQRFVFFKPVKAMLTVSCTLYSGNNPNTPTSQDLTPKISLRRHPNAFKMRCHLEK